MTFWMLLDKKRISLYGIPAIILVISTAYLLLPPQLRLSYDLDDSHRAEVEPQGTWSNMTCPQCGSQLERIVIDPDSQRPDDAWRYAYYCRRADIFWIADCPGFYFAGWYGPFDAQLRLKNTVAIGLAIVSGVALVLLAFRDKVLAKTYLD